jgi:uncharacterized repeat protein (TIGR03803 family)
MYMNRQWIIILATAVIIPGLLRSAAATDTEDILHIFTDENGDGSGPSSGLVFDPVGNLYGTTYAGGAYENGTVYKMMPNSNGSWTESIIYSFTGGSDGETPIGTLALDAQGNLYGTARFGANTGDYACCGSVFELSPTSSGWQYSLLYTFTGGDDGKYPSASVILGADGSLYGTAFEGGTYGVGTVFSLTPKAGGIWKFSLLHTFTGGKDGGYPNTNLIFDAMGSLYATTAYGGSGSACRMGCGTVYKLTPAVGGWRETALHEFTGGLDGWNPSGGLIFDAAGNLYGAAGNGGAHGQGVVYELEPFSGGWKDHILHSFIGKSDGGYPSGSLTFDPEGNLYGASSSGGVGFGTAFELTPLIGRWDCVLLYTFYTNSSDSADPTGSFVIDSSGNLYGAAAGGTYYAAGTVFELSPPSSGRA